MMDELEAIADGRSLHRRLVVPRSADEMARLALSLNGMIARLEQSFSSLRRFTADASHELKTPLMVVRAGVERVLTSPRTPPEIMELLDETLNQINWMNELVETLLTLARADERATVLARGGDRHRRHPGRCGGDGRDAGRGGRNHCQPGRAGRAGHAPGGRGPDPPAPPQPGDQRDQVHARGRVDRPPAEGPGAGGGASVRDSGIGIAPGDVPHVFDRFWRADMVRTRTGDRAGFGLGLAISKWIAEAHGGTIARAEPARPRAASSPSRSPRKRRPGPSTSGPNPPVTVLSFPRDPAAICPLYPWIDSQTEGSMFDSWSRPRPARRPAAMSALSLIAARRGDLRRGKAGARAGGAVPGPADRGHRVLPAVATRLPGRLSAGRAVRSVNADCPDRFHLLLCQRGPRLASPDTTRMGSTRRFRTCPARRRRNRAISPRSVSKSSTTGTSMNRRCRSFRSARSILPGSVGAG